MQFAWTWLLYSIRFIKVNTTIHKDQALRSIFWYCTSSVIACEVGCYVSNSIGLLPDTQNCGLCMRRESRERFPRHRLQRKPLVSDPGMHHGTCVRHVPLCMSASLTRGDGGKRSQHSRRMRNPQFCISGKRPIWLKYTSGMHWYHSLMVGGYYIPVSIGWITPFLYIGVV